MFVPAQHFACRVRSVEFFGNHPLPIDELKGTKPTERIDLSGKERKALELSPVSAIIIASCIKGNGSLKELRYGAHLHTIPHSRSAPAEYFSSARSLADNRLVYISDGTYTTDGITALCEGLKGSPLTALE